MLQELRIKDFAIIDALDLRLAPGFQVITGETGAGKSIIVDAVTLLLGERSDATFVRGGAERSVIEGIFSVPDGVRDDLRAILEAEGLEGDGADEIILSREVRANGRSVARVNGIACALSVYREIGGLLVDIHGQGEHLSLLRPSQHLYLLDRYAGVEAQRAEVAAMVRELSAVRAEIASLLTDEAALARRVDMLQFQIEEITTADPRPEEEAELAQERTRLANAEKIAELANEAYYALVGEAGESAGTDRLAQAALALSKLVRLDPALQDAYTLAESISIQADELARTLRDYNDDTEYDPRRLDEIEERVELLNRLKRKYGGTIEDVLAHAAHAQAELDTITHSEERLATLRAEEDRLLRAIGDAAAALSRVRREAADRLTEAIVRELGDLKMKGARFEGDHARAGLGRRVHRGRAFRFTRPASIRSSSTWRRMSASRCGPLVKVASGGETARIMLALKSVLSYADRVPTLIFDESRSGHRRARRRDRRAEAVAAFGPSPGAVRHASGAAGRVRRRALPRHQARRGTAHRDARRAVERSGPRGRAGRDARRGDD